jgi:hypothetical protein
MPSACMSVASFGHALPSNSSGAMKIGVPSRPDLVVRRHLHEARLVRGHRGPLQKTTCRRGSCRARRRRSRTSNQSQSIGLSQRSLVKRAR